MDHVPSVVPPAQNQVAVGAPAFLANMNDRHEGKKELDGHATVARISVVHGSSDQERQAFGVGSLILTPDMVRLANAGEAVAVAPLLMYVTYEKHRDNDDPLKQAEGHVIDKTFDPRSDIARRSQHPDTWSEPYPNMPNLNYRYIEAYNYYVQILEGPAAGVVAQVTFSSTSHKYGKRMNGYLSRFPHAVFAARVLLKTDTDTDGNNTWRVLTYAIDEANQYSAQTQEAYDDLKLKRSNLKELLEVAKEMDAKARLPQPAPQPLTAAETQHPQQSVHVSQPAQPQPQPRMVVETQQPQGYMPIPQEDLPPQVQVEPGGDPEKTPF